MHAMDPKQAVRKRRTTQLLNRMLGGDPQAESEVWPLIYADLHELASGQMARQPSHHTLQPTALIHEAWLRISSSGAHRLESKRQFYAIASKAMRSVLIDSARARSAVKRGGSRTRICLDVAADSLAEEGEIVALHEALVDLEEHDLELARIVELRCFGGMAHAEIAATLGSSLRSVERAWRFARAWLREALEK